MNPLKEGEIICDQCNGIGYIRKKNYYENAVFPEIPLSCEKCQGDGKLDWIENIVGKPKKKHPINIDFSTKYRMTDYEIDLEILKNVANKLKNDIDKKILDYLMNGNLEYINESNKRR